ncbi:MAG: hypothetical protein GY861_14180 [bacterium]|nr:hypothetical protein [bacterium]
MNVEKLASKIYNFIKKHPESTIVDLEDNVKGFTGDQILYIPNYKIPYWADVSQDAVIALAGLLAEGKLYIKEVPGISCLVVLQDTDEIIGRNRPRLYRGWTLTFKARSY